MNHFIKRSFVAVMLCACTVCINAQHRITLHVSGLTGGTINLAQYKGNKALVAEKAESNAMGTIVFEGNNTLSDGFYIAVLPNKKKIEFIIEGQSQDFVINCNIVDIDGTCEAEGSDANQVFFKYKRLNKHMRWEQEQLTQKINQHQSIISQVPEDGRGALQDSINRWSAERAAIPTKMKEYQDYVCNTYPNSVFVAMLNCSKDVRIPSYVTTPEEIKQYRCQHYFDEINLADSRLVHVYTYVQKVDRYITTEIPQHPDTIAAAVDLLLNQILEREQKGYEGELYCFTFNYLFEKFQDTRFQGYDRLFCHMVEQYIYTNKIPERLLQDRLFMERVNTRYRATSPSCIGNIAKDLRLYSNNNEWVNTNSIAGDFTVMIFYDVECEHCAEVIAEWQKELTQKNLPAITTQLIYTGVDDVKWREAAKKYNNRGFYNLIDVNQDSRAATFYDITSTPVIYVLDSDKKIIGRKLPVGHVIPTILKHTK